MVVPWFFLHNELKFLLILQNSGILYFSDLTIKTAKCETPFHQCKFSFLFSLLSLRILRSSTCQCSRCYDIWTMESLSSVESCLMTILLLPLIHCSYHLTVILEEFASSLLLFHYLGSLIKWDRRRVRGEYKGQGEWRGLRVKGHRTGKGS